jgi:hypothetical protein
MEINNNLSKRLLNRDILNLDREQINDHIFNCIGSSLLPLNQIRHYLENPPGLDELYPSKNHSNKPRKNYENKTSEYVKPVSRRSKK